MLEIVNDLYGGTDVYNNNWGELNTVIKVVFTKAGSTSNVEQLQREETVRTECISTQSPNRKISDGIVLTQVCHGVSNDRIDDIKPDTGSGGETKLLRAGSFAPDYSIFIQMGWWEPCSTFDGSGFGAATCNDCWTKVRGPKRLARLMSTDVDCCNVLQHCHGSSGACISSLNREEILCQPSGRRWTSSNTQPARSGFC